MSAYRALLARPGARGLALACGLGWLSFGSYGLAIVLAVHAASGSFAAAGAAIAAFSAGAGALAPLRGRLVDARGPRALAAFAPLSAGALALLAIGCLAGWSGPALACAAGAAGAAMPPLIATARSVWPAVAGPDLSRAAHALNAALGDGAQVVGPALTGAIAGLASPVAALLVLIPGPAAGALLLAARHGGRDAPRAGPPAARRVLGARGESAALRTLAAADLAGGVGFGALDVALPATARVPALAAVPLALFAAGSVGASVWSGSAAGARPAASRYLAGALLAAVAVAPCAVVRSLDALSGLLLAAGACFGVLNVALFELLDEVVEPHRAVEALTWLTTLQGAGAAAGAALAGRLAQDGLVLVAVAAACGAAVAAGRRGTLQASGLRRLTDSSA
jgi:MFS family permease